MNTCLKMPQHGKKGKLITFCGLDGCGKSTLIRLLTEKLEQDGQTVFLTKQPTNEMRQSGIFRTYMDCKDHSKYEYRALSLMAAADRIQHVIHVILPALEEGKTVISIPVWQTCGRGAIRKIVGSTRLQNKFQNRITLSFWMLPLKWQSPASVKGRRRETDTLTWSCNTGFVMNIAEFVWKTMGFVFPQIAVSWKHSKRSGKK